MRIFNDYFASDQIFVNPCD